MCVNEEFECSVCYFKYDRSNRVPRVLHCHHTFCARCLDAICTTNGAICCITCPLCRWITCTRSSLSLTGFLFVNTDIWDHLTEEHLEMRDGSVADLTQAQLKASTLPHPRKLSFQALMEKLFRRWNRNERVNGSLFSPRVLNRQSS